MVVPKKWVLLLMTSVVLTTCLVFVFSLFLVAKTIHLMTQEAQKNVNLEIFFKEDLKEDDLSWIDSLKTKFEIQEISLVSKAQAQNVFSDLMKGDWGSLAEDPQLIKNLPASAVIQFHNELHAETLGSVTQKVVFEAQQLQNFDSYIFQKDWAQWLSAYQDFVSDSFLGLSFFIALLIFLIISNLNRSYIFQRSKEIEIYYLIGATKWQIEKPFILKSMMIGLISAVLSLSITASLKNLIALKAHQLIPAQQIASFSLLDILIFNVMLILLCGFSARLCVRGYLK